MLSFSICSFVLLAQDLVYFAFWKDALWQFLRLEANLSRRAVNGKRVDPGRKSEGQVVVTDHVEHVPAIGETLDFKGLRFEVVEADSKRVNRVRLSGIDQGSDDGESRPASE